MSHSFARTAASLILAPCIAFSAILAPEHAHQADADHPLTTVHRHTQPHEAGPHHHDDDHVQLADDDGHVVWLDSATQQQLPYRFAAPLAPPVDLFEPAPPIADWTAKPDFNAAPPHGPPRSCLSLRAPPPSLSA